MVDFATRERAKKGSVVRFFGSAVAGGLAAEGVAMGGLYKLEEQFGTELDPVANFGIVVLTTILGVIGGAIGGYKWAQAHYKAKTK